MELSSHHHEKEEEIPMPINTSFIGVHAHSHAHHGHIQHGHITHHQLHHHHDLTSSSSHNPHIIIPPSNNSNGTIMEEHNIHQHHHTHHLNDTNEHKSNGKNHDNNDNDDDDDDDDDHHDDGKKKKKMIIRYKECQKNHAAKMGGNAKDGCGEFMPNGEEGTLESLICSVCNCHRNFHRKEIQGHHHDDELQNHHHNIIPPLSTTTPHSQFYPSTPYPHLLNKGRKVILGSTPSGVGYPTGPIVPYSRSLTINMPPTTYTPSEQSDHHHNYGYDYNQVVKKRFRTKFSQEQKEKMLEFAQKVGWKIQKQEESVVQQFCQEIGVKRRVLKVWMHNNKHNLAKKNDNIILDHNNVNNSS